MSKQVLQYNKKERKNSIYVYRIINYDTDMKLSERNLMVAYDLFK